MMYERMWIGNEVGKVAKGPIVHRLISRERSLDVILSAIGSH
jgi:hypothetical protein